MKSCLTRVMAFCLVYTLCSGKILAQPKIGYYYPTMMPRINSTSYLDFSPINPAFSGLDTLSKVTLAFGHSNATWQNGYTFRKFATDTNYNNLRGFDQEQDVQGYYTDMIGNTCIGINQSLKLGFSFSRAYERYDSYMNGTIDRVGMSLVFPMNKLRLSIGTQLKYEKWLSRQPILYPNFTKEYAEFKINNFDWAVGFAMTNDKNFTFSVAAQDLSRSHLQSMDRGANFYNGIVGTRNYSIIPRLSHAIIRDKFTSFEYDLIGMFVRRYDKINFQARVNVKVQNIRVGMNARNLDQDDKLTIGPFISMMYKGVTFQYNYLSQFNSFDATDMSLHELGLNWRVEYKD